MKNRKIGFCITGSFCTFEPVIPVIEELVNDNEVTVIMSPAAYETDTRFYKAEDFKAICRELTGREIMHTIVEAEQIGPKKLFDIVLIAPCTSNTLAKINWGINDTCVTMAAKSHIRNGRPLVIAISTNDALGAAGQSISMLLNKKLVYFVPYGQDDSEKKPRSMVADMGKCVLAMEKALEGEQLQPLIFD